MCILELVKMFMWGLCGWGNGNLVFCFGPSETTSLPLDIYRIKMRRDMLYLLKHVVFPIFTYFDFFCISDASFFAQHYITFPASKVCIS